MQNVGDGFSVRALHHAFSPVLYGWCMILKSQDGDTPQSLLLPAFVCFSLLLALFLAGTYALTFPVGAIMVTVVQATLFLAGTLGFMSFLDFCKKIMLGLSLLGGGDSPSNDVNNVVK